MYKHIALSITSLLYNPSIGRETSRLFLANELNTLLTTTETREQYHSHQVNINGLIRELPRPYLTLIQDPIQNIINNFLITERDTLLSLLSQTPDTDEAKVFHTTEVIEILNQNPILIYAKNKWGKNPLHVAAKKGHIEIVISLIAKGAEVNTENNVGETPLHYAVWKGHIDAVIALLAHGADKDAKNTNGETPLHWAVINGHTDIAQVLIEARAHVNAQDNEGFTPLHGAAQGGHTEIVKTLIANGAIVSAIANNDSTPLHWAGLNRHTDVIQVLLQARSDIMAKAGNGGTPTLGGIPRTDRHCNSTPTSRGRFKGDKSQRGTPTVYGGRKKT